MRSQRTTKLWWRVSMAASLLVAGTGGGMMLLENLPAGTWSVALNMLTLGMVGFLVSVFGAWLTRNDDAAKNPSSIRSPGSAVSRLVFVVRQDRRDLFEVLRASLAREENVNVVLDRRDRPRDAFDREVRRRGWSVARVEA